MGLIKGMEQTAELIRDHHSFLQFYFFLPSLFLSLLLLCVLLIIATSSRVTGPNAAILSLFTLADIIRGVQEFLSDVCSTASGCWKHFLNACALEQYTNRCKQVETWLFTSSSHTISFKNLKLLKLAPCKILVYQCVKAAVLCEFVYSTMLRYVCVCVCLHKSLSAAEFDTDGESSCLDDQNPVFMSSQTHKPSSFLSLSLSFHAPF